MRERMTMVGGAVVREASKQADAPWWQVFTWEDVWFGYFFAGRNAREITCPVYHNTIWLRKGSAMFAINSEK
jgi:hypothetical protein